MTHTETSVTAVRLSFKIRYAIVSALLSCVFIAAACIMYTNYVDEKAQARERKNDQQWCELIMFYDTYYSSNPPSNELQRQQAKLMHDRRISLGCPLQ